MGVENIWQLRQCGDSQVFNQGEGSVGYGVVVIKNIFWPGWVTIGYVFIPLFRKEDLLIFTMDLVINQFNLHIVLLKTKIYKKKESKVKTITSLIPKMLLWLLLQPREVNNLHLSSDTYINLPIFPL